VHKNILLVDHIKENGMWLKDIGGNANLGEDGVQALDTRFSCNYQGVEQYGFKPQNINHHKAYD
jgi:hypothetical protein